MGFVDFYLFLNAYFLFIEPIQSVVLKPIWRIYETTMRTCIEPIQSVVLKRNKMKTIVGVNDDWTHTECCIETVANSWLYIVSSLLNPYRVLYWNNWINPIWALFDVIEPIQSVVLKHYKTNRERAVSQNWTHTECCIETQSFLFLLTALKGDLSEIKEIIWNILNLYALHT